MLKWPDSRCVRRALGEWARDLEGRHPEVVGIGYFGSYARGDWGVGSDLDLILIVRGSNSPGKSRGPERDGAAGERRALAFDKEGLPVPADLLVYALHEWRALSASGSGFAKMIAREAVWLKTPPPDPRG